MSSGASAWPGGSPVAGWAWPSRPRLSLKDCAASIPRAPPQFLFDSEQPVVLGRAVGRDNEPGLILPVVQPTARSAIVTSSVSPDRGGNKAREPARLPIPIGPRVSLSVPIL